MNEKLQRNYDLHEKMIGFAVRVLAVVESWPNSTPSFPSSLHHSLLDIPSSGERIAQQYNHRPTRRTRGK